MFSWTPIFESAELLHFPYWHSQIAPSLLEILSGALHPLDQCSSHSSNTHPIAARARLVKARMCCRSRHLQWNHNRILIIVHKSKASLLIVRLLAWKACSMSCGSISQLAVGQLPATMWGSLRRRFKGDEASDAFVDNFFQECAREMVDIIQTMSDFVLHQHQNRRRIVVVTCGSTSTSLDRHSMVRVTKDTFVSFGSLLMLHDWFACHTE